MITFKEHLLNTKTKTLWCVARKIIDNYMPKVEGRVIRCSVVHTTSNDAVSLYDKVMHETSVVSIDDLDVPIAKINIQQLKLNKLNVLYIVLFFEDEAVILKYYRHELEDMSKLYRFQHKDNTNEAQFMISEANLRTEIEDHLLHAMSYDTIEHIIREEDI